MDASSTFRMLAATLWLATLTATFSQCTSAIEVDCASTEIEIEGFATGYASCGTFRHRLVKESCPVFEHAAPTECADVPESDDPACNSDGDCDEKTFGRCLPNGTFGCGCSYGCSTDEDCEEDAICLCGQPFGKCVRATCKADSDCAHEGALCAEAPTTVCDIGSVTGFACFQPSDECIEDDECEEKGAHCVLGHDAIRTCQPGDACVIP